MHAQNHRPIGLLRNVNAGKISISGSAVANHDHNLITPGTTVVDIVNGQTEKCASDAGGHSYHEHVHLGMPGMFAYENPHHPVSVIKTESASC
jgi:hypothetical protein